MARMNLACPRCLERISHDDTVVLGSEDIVVHLDCRRPHSLSPEERALLFKYCFGHAVAECLACSGSFRQVELASDLMGNRMHLCPRCRADLTESVRGHLYRCTTMPSELQRRAREMREATQKLLKRSQETVDRADVLVRETEAAIDAKRNLMLALRAAHAALRETMRRWATRER